MNESLFFGHTASYWLELECNAEKLDVVDYIEEVSRLRSKVSFYESRIDQMNDFMTKYLEVKK